MTAKNRNPNRGRSDAQRGFAENLARLVDHLQLFFGVTAIHKGVDVGNTIEGNLVWKFLHLQFLPVIKGGDLLAQFLHRLSAGPGHRLIGRHHHPLDARRIVNRLERHDHLDGRAIWIGNDTAIFIVCDLLRIDFGHDQRDVGRIRKQAVLSTTTAPALDRDRSELGAHATAGGEEPDIDPLKESSVRTSTLIPFPLNEGIVRPISRRLKAAVRPPGTRAPPTPPHLLADGAGGAHDCNIVVLFFH